ncbi:alpha/beta hydrolase [Psychromarinibacter sp. S121]|uniref:alpha/beta hydrolase n=1 Tax=Psychromarinibacter sp. S121 TaxID=3415127 RepID=UPI003C7E306A
MSERTGMDRQMSLDDVSDLDQLFERRGMAAKAGLDQFDVRRAVPYGPGQGETLNIFPAGEGAPVLVFIHGGFWRSLDADLFSFIAPGFVPFGVCLVVIDYPLIPTVRLGDIVDACQRSVAWVAENIAAFGGDPDRIHIAGNSAGGHLVAELASRPGAELVRGGTAISGLYDLAPVTRSFQNDDLQLTPEEVADFSPLSRSLEIRMPMIVSVGGDETQEFLRQTDDFAAKIGVLPYHAAGTNHITVLLDALADPTDRLNRLVRAQMGLGIE